MQLRTQLPLARFPLSTAALRVNPEHLTVIPERRYALLQQACALMELRHVIIALRQRFQATLPSATSGLPSYQQSPRDAWLQVEVSRACFAISSVHFSLLTDWVARGGGGDGGGVTFVSAEILFQSFLR